MAVREFQDQQVEITKLRRVKWLKDSDVFVFDVKAYGDTNCT